MKDSAEKIAWWMLGMSVVFGCFYFLSGFFPNFDPSTREGLLKIIMGAGALAVGGKSFNLVGEGIRKNGFRVVGDNNYELEEEEDKKEIEPLPSFSKRDQ